MSMLRDLDGRSTMGDVVFVQCARSAADVVFGRELLAIAERHPRLKVVIRRDDANTAGQLDLAALREIVPDFDERETFLCGPPGMMSVVGTIYDAVGSAHRLRIERFVAAKRVEGANDTRAEGSVTLRLSRTGRTVGVGPGTVLEQLERAGERPAFGCRMGICQTCRCRKRSGAVMDLNTGRVSNEPDEDIRLCVSVAQSDLDLAL
jgi:ferredoxin-NADP reductase